MNSNKEWLWTWIVGVYFTLLALNSIILLHYFGAGGHIFTSFHPSWHTPVILTTTSYITITEVWVLVTLTLGFIGDAIAKSTGRRGPGKGGVAQSVALTILLVTYFPVMYLIFSTHHHGLMGDYFLLADAFLFSATFGYIMGIPKKAHSKSSDTNKDNT